MRCMMDDNQRPHLSKPTLSMNGLTESQNLSATKEAFGLFYLYNLLYGPPNATSINTNQPKFCRQLAKNKANNSLNKIESKLFNSSQHLQNPKWITAFPIPDINKLKQRVKLGIAGTRYARLAVELCDGKQPMSQDPATRGAATGAIAALKEYQAFCPNWIMHPSLADQSWASWFPNFSENCRQVILQFQTVEQLANMKKANNYQYHGEMKVKEEIKHWRSWFPPDNARKEYLQKGKQFDDNGSPKQLTI